MAFDDLSRFLQAAADASELERIALSMAPDQEIAALTHQICQEFRGAGPVILFEAPTGYSMPVVVNLLGNRSRFLNALGAETLDEVVQRVREAFCPIPAASQRQFGFSLSTAVSDRSRLMPRVMRRGLCQQVVKLGQDVDLRQFPALRSWPGESGPLITAGQVITASVAGASSLEWMPVEVLDRQTLQLHWNPLGPTCRHWQGYGDQRQMPVAISLGGDPLLSYVASLPLPDWIDPWFFAGILRHDCVNLVRGRAVELNVPAEAEIVFEGYLDFSPATGTGTAANEQGLLRTGRDLPQFQVTSLTHRANPLFPARIQSLDGSEELIFGQLTERLLLGMLQLTHPQVLDLHLPAWGGHREAVLIRTNATVAEEVQRLLHSVCSLPLIAQASLIVAVGPDVDLRHDAAVWREVCLSRPGTSGLARWPGLAGGERLVLDATPASRGVLAASRCEPSAEILAVLAQRFGNPGWEESETAVSRAE